MERKEAIKKKLGIEALRRPAFLAPMAGYTDLPFRRIAAREGSAMQTTELVSAAGICHAGPEKSRRYLAAEPEAEGAVLIQLFGSKPEEFLQAAEILLADPRYRGVSGFDINMGCPVPKVVKSGAGSALMQEPERAFEIVSRLAPLLHAEGYLLGVKMRRGFAGEEETAPETACLMAEAGADLICIHGRFREQYYAGAADWGVIRRAEEALRERGLREQVLLIANGDIRDAADYERCIRETGADAGAVGRAAAGKPWIFRAFAETPKPEPDAEEQALIIREHAEASARFLGEATAMREFRKILAAYAAGRPQARLLRREAGKISSLQDIEAWLGLFLGEEAAERLNES